jgi:hypothetical protein
LTFQFPDGTFFHRHEVVALILATLTIQRSWEIIEKKQTIKEKL